MRIVRRCSREVDLPCLLPWCTRKVPRGGAGWLELLLLLSTSRESSADTRKMEAVHVVSGDSVLYLERLTEGDRVGERRKISLL